MMTTTPSLFRRAYDGVALFALLNLLVFGGLGAYLLWSGVIDGEKVRSIAAVLRGDEEEQQVEPQTEPAEASAERVEAASTEDVIAASQRGLEVMRREEQRIRAELDQRLALNNSIMLRVMTERQTFKEEQEATSDRDRAIEQRQETEGFKKQIEIYEGLAPKVAVEHLLGLADVDQAARLLLEMETRKAKKIIEAAKRPDQMESMKIILQRLGEAAPGRSDELTPGG